MSKTFLFLLALAASVLLACDYDQELEVLDVTVRLIYPANTIAPYSGARVELKNAAASVFVDSTDADGTAHFTVPPGVYEATSANTLLTDDYRYVCNGVRSQIVIAPDSINQVDVTLTVTKKRIVH